MSERTIRGVKVLLDKQDEYLFDKYKWTINRDGYVRTSSRIGGY